MREGEERDKQWADCYDRVNILDELLEEPVEFGLGEKLRLVFGLRVSISELLIKIGNCQKNRQFCVRFAISPNQQKLK